MRAVRPARWRYGEREDGAVYHRMIRAALGRDWLPAYVLVAPSLVLIGAFTVYPIIAAVYNSFFDWNLIDYQVKTAVGVRNYVHLLRDRDFWSVVWNTVVFTLGTVPISMALALLVALPLTRRIAGLSFYRTAYFLPVVTPIVAISLGWMLLFDANYGLINYLLGFLRIPPQPWLSRPESAMAAVITMSVWKGLGFGVVIYIAGIHTIPLTLYEAATIDGAGAGRQFASITWPLLVPTTFFILIISTISSFQAFGQIYVLTRGGPVRSTTTIVYDLYMNAFEFFKMGYASAESILLFLLLGAFTVAQWRMSRRQQEILF